MAVAADGSVIPRTAIATAVTAEAAIAVAADDEKQWRRRGSIRAKNGRLPDGAFYLSLHAVSVPVIECM